MKRKQTRDHSEVVRNEEALIGSILTNPKVLDRISFITPGSFFSQELGQLFGIIRRRYESDLPCDPILIVNECRDAGLPFNSGDIAKLFVEVPHSAHAPYYGGQVTESARLRKLVEIQDVLNDDLSDRTMNSHAIIERLEKTLDTLRQDTHSGLQTLHGAGQKLIAECEQENSKRRSAETGIYSVDRMIGGLMAGEMIVLAARPGVGKTSLAMQIAIHNADRDRRSLFVSLEMRAEELAARVFGGLADVSSSDLRSRDLSQAQLECLKDAVAKMERLPLVVYDPAQATMRDIRAVAKSSGDLSLIVIDYLSLVKPTDSRSQRWEQVSEISRQIKRLAKELKVPILCLQQLSREADGQVPKLSHLRESGSIEQDADVVAFLHPDSVKTWCSLFVAKNRHGSTAEIRLTFDGPTTTFKGRSDFD
jgi:replicative DNA helicase